MKAAPYGYMFDCRICPGRHFALRTFFLNISYTLAVFHISAPTGEKLEAKFEESTIRYVLISDPYLATLVPASKLTPISRHPVPFKCVIKPRSAASLKVVRDAGMMAD